MQNILSAAELRHQMQTKSLEVEQRPGVYRWWFPQKQGELLFTRIEHNNLLKKEKIQVRIIQKEYYLGLYYGISSNINRRIRWHIRGPFKSSTLRRTLRAIIAPEADDCTAEQFVNQVIDKCFLEWDYTNTTKDAEQLETKELTQTAIAYPLNISKNLTMPAEWITELKQLRASVPH